MGSRKLPLIAFVGRPNVGKSTLFNRLVGSRVAIVDPTPGVTRDRIFGRCSIDGLPAELVDTGGLTSYGRKSEMDRNIEKQVMMSIESATLVLFVVDTIDGLMPEDKYTADILRRYDRPVLVVANKADDKSHEVSASEFFELGYDEPVAVSALHGKNVEKLFARIKPYLPEPEEDEEGEKPVRFCVVGRPNVGKSSIVNAILGEERCVVSEVAGTTRDMVNTTFSRDGSPYVIVDTAGVRKRRKKMDRIEYFGTTRSKRAIAGSDVALLILDAQDGILEGDKKLIDAIFSLKKGLVIAVNKMDLVDNPVYDEFIEYVQNAAPFIRQTPLIFVSALEREGMDMVLDTLLRVHERMNAFLPLELLKNIIFDIRSFYSPGSKGNRMGEIKAVVHDLVNPPRVVIKVNDPNLFPESYRRLIENQIRSVFDLSGVPLDLVFMESAKKKKK